MTLKLIYIWLISSLLTYIKIFQATLRQEGLIGRVKNARGEPVKIDESTESLEPEISLPSKPELSPPRKGTFKKWSLLKCYVIIQFFCFPSIFCSPSNFFYMYMTRDNNFQLMKTASVV